MKKQLHVYILKVGNDNSQVVTHSNWCEFLFCSLIIFSKSYIIDVMLGRIYTSDVQLKKLMHKYGIFCAHF